MMGCSGQGSRPCSSPRATWWAGSCRSCEPTDDRARYGLPRGELLTPDRVCPSCGREWPADSVCHRCGSQAAPLQSYWEALGKERPPEVSAAAQVVGAVIDAYAETDENGAPTPASLAELAEALGFRGCLAQWVGELAAGRCRLESHGRWLAREDESTPATPRGKRRG